MLPRPKDRPQDQRHEGRQQHEIDGQRMLPRRFGGDVRARGDPAIDHHQRPHDQAGPEHPQPVAAPKIPCDDPRQGERGKGRQDEVLHRVLGLVVELAALG